MTESHKQQTSFEETYKQQEFSELVRLSLALAAWWRRTGTRRSHTNKTPEEGSESSCSFNRSDLGKQSI